MYRIVDYERSHCHLEPRRQFMPSPPSSALFFNHSSNALYYFVKPANCSKPQYLRLVAVLHTIYLVLGVTLVDISAASEIVSGHTSILAEPASHESTELKHWQMAASHSCWQLITLYRVKFTVR